MSASPRVGIVMGSDSDWPTAEPAVAVLAELGVSSEVRVLSAHRTPHRLLEYGASAADRDLQVLIGAAGGAAHLPGMLAAVTPLPVIGLPVPLVHLDGVDSLLSIVQMPAGIPVATVAIGAGRNAGLLAARIIGGVDPSVRAALVDHQRALAEVSEAKDRSLRERLGAPSNPGVDQRSRMPVVSIRTQAKGSIPRDEVVTTASRPASSPPGVGETFGLPEPEDPCP